MITLTSDFGLKDPYVAEMKGVILSLNSNAKIVDISHEVEQFNIRMGAYILASAAPFFPKGTIHLAVIDPGVGSARQAVIIQTKEGFFVGPDNGLLMLAAQRQEITHTFEIENPNFTLSKVSSTFHGRDIFAPVAAHLDKGKSPKEFGPEIETPIMPPFAVTSRSRDIINGEVLYIDRFGNIITNISPNEVSCSKNVKIKLAGISLDLSFLKTYSQAKSKEPILLVGSHGFLELALNQGNLSKKLSAKIGDPITLFPI